MSNAPDAPAGQQDFIKGWPSRELLERDEFVSALRTSYTAAIDTLAGSALNYGTKEEGAFMLGHPEFLNALAEFLAKFYGKEVDPKTLMSTGGSSMATDIATRVHTKPGDIGVTEAPTYYLAHQMFRESGLELREVGMQPDGMDLDALEELLKKEGDQVKILYTVPVHHNPTGITMSNEKRVRLLALAKQYDFKIVADEAYQLLSFSDPGVVPLYYHDDPADPRVISVGTFSKLIGPGMKVGWAQAHPDLLKPMQGIGFINSGNNPVIFNSVGIAQFVKSGALADHIAYISKEIGRKAALLSEELRKAGLEFTEPQGGYFVWVQSKEGKMTGRSGRGMTLDPPDRYADFMRLCFAWLSDEQIVEGVRYLKEQPAAAEAKA